MEKRGTFQTFLHTRLMVELMEMLGHHSRGENVGFQKDSRFCDDCHIDLTLDCVLRSRILGYDFCCPGHSDLERCGIDTSWDSRSE